MVLTKQNGRFEKIFGTILNLDNQRDLNLLADVANQSSLEQD